MAKIRNTFSGLRNGRIGGISYYSQRGIEIARVAQNSSNYGETASRTQAQQSRRIMWANLVNFYKYSRRWLVKGFQSKGERQTDYNAFMSANLAGARIPLTREQAQGGGIVLDSFIVSRGTLASVTDTSVTDSLDSLIECPENTISLTTTVGALSAALIAANDFITEGMQISLILYTQVSHAAGEVPVVAGNAYEITLDSSSTELVASYLPTSLITDADGVLQCSLNANQAGYWIISITSGSQTLVSSESLVIKTPLATSWATADQINAAIASYGLTETAFLMSGSSPSGTTGGSGGSGGSSGGGTVEE